jgi:hypothetical protein
MNITTLVSTIKSNVRKARLLHDFSSGYTQILDANQETVWAGNIKDLGSDEFIEEVIPALQEAE